MTLRMWESREEGIQENKPLAQTGSVTHMASMKKTKHGLVLTLLNGSHPRQLAQ